MSLATSTFELRFNNIAPGFELPDAWGKKHLLKNVAGKNGTVIVFACNHCPYVIHIAKALGQFAKTYAAHGVNTVAINSNDIQTFPQDGPEPMKEFARQYGWDFPYLIDETQMIAKSYGAACTPDFFLIDGEGKIIYTGQFDGSRPGSDVVANGADLIAAINCLLTDQPPARGLPSSGCSIKWKPGKEPRWFAAVN
jgi:peroxiredoxin